MQKILSCCEPQWFFVQLHFERDFSHLWTRVDTDFVLEKKFILCFTFFSFSFSLSFLPFPRNFHWLLLCFIVWYIQIIKSTLAYKKFPCLRKRKRFFLKHSMNQKLHLKWDKVVKSPENDWATISQNLIIYMVLYSIRRKFNSSTLFSGSHIMPPPYPCDNFRSDMARGAAFSRHFYLFIYVFYLSWNVQCPRSLAFIPPPYPYSLGQWDGWRLRGSFAGFLVTTREFSMKESAFDGIIWLLNGWLGPLQLLLLSAWRREKIFPHKLWAYILWRMQQR